MLDDDDAAVEGLLRHLYRVNFASITTPCEERSDSDSAVDLYIVGEIYNERTPKWQAKAVARLALVALLAIWRKRLATQKSRTRMAMQ